jgi:predicted acyl esterase
MSDIKVPILSVGNWGGILLHLRGNVEGYLNAGSNLRYLRFITGRHDLPFYGKENVEMQKSFLDAFLKGNDTQGWSTGQAPKVGLVLRKGNVGYNNVEAEKQYRQRFENEWPIARTEYTKYFLTLGKQLVDTLSYNAEQSQLLYNTQQPQLSYMALGALKNPQFVQFVSEPFHHETEITGHIVVHLNVSLSAITGAANTPSELDLFLTLRHLDPMGNEILYTGTVGDPVPVTKGWLRASLRKTEPSNPRFKPWYPHREYRSTDVLPVKPGEVYGVDVEVWPTNVVVDKGNRLVLEVSSGDTQGAGIFEHTSDADRPRQLLEGWNHINFGPEYENYVILPIIPSQ